MTRRLLVAAVNAVAWPLARLLSAWDAADQRLASTYANSDHREDDQ